VHLVHHQLVAIPKLTVVSMATGRDDKARARTGYSRASSWTTGRRTGPACRRRTAGPRLDRAPGWRDGRAARRPRSGLPLLLPLREQQTEATPWTQAKHVPASEQNTHVAAPTRAQARRTVRTPIDASRRASPDILSRYSRDLHVFWLLCIDIAFFFQVGRTRRPLLVAWLCVGVWAAAECAQGVPPPPWRPSRCASTLSSWGR
jgi:hypothetical protein